MAESQVKAWNSMVYVDTCHLPHDTAEVTKPLSVNKTERERESRGYNTRNKVDIGSGWSSEPRKSGHMLASRMCL